MEAREKFDRRATRTRTALRRAFVDLVLEKGYATLTPDEVADRADVGRSTLYAHYGGLHGLLRESLESPCGPLAGLVDGSVGMDALVRQLEHFRDQRRRNHVFFVDPLRGLWVRRLAELIAPKLGPTQALPQDLAALQIAEAQIALVHQWLAARPAPPVEQVASAMMAITRALRTALAAPRQPPED